MLLIHNIRKLYTMRPIGRDPLGCIENAALIVGDDGLILYAGSQSTLPQQKGFSSSIDAKRALVLPGFIDCHTHLVFAGSRADEFAARARGATYQEIMQKGGGIKSTVRATREASVQDLVASTLPRLAQSARLGITTMEIKTGYGLALEHELKMLDAMKTLRVRQQIELEATFLGAHTIPKEWEGRSDEYVDLIVTEMLPAVSAQGVATACDVFVERGAFNVAQAREIYAKAKSLGLKCHVHAEQLSHFGGAALAAEIGALSASHLEYATDDDIERLARANVVAAILPVAQEYLNLKPVHARRFIDKGLDVAVATDFNPGSAMCNDLHLAARLAITRGGLTCEEAALSITANAAKALGRHDIGALATGLQGDLCLLECASLEDFFYDWTHNPVVTAIKKGKMVVC
jgi:imidazolonepropionase